ncbi:unnamed protein product, partial [Mesorhabditis spiculigera]
MTIGLGGWGSRRKPMAFVRAILRSDIKDLTVVTYGGLDLGRCARPARSRRRTTVSCPGLRTVPRSVMDEGMVVRHSKPLPLAFPSRSAQAWVPDVRNSGATNSRPSPPRTPRPTAVPETLIAMPALNLDASFVHLNLVTSTAMPRTTVSTQSSAQPHDGRRRRRGPWNGAHFTLAGESYGRDEKFQRHYAEAAKTPESWQTFVDTFLSGSEGGLPSRSKEACRSIKGRSRQNERIHRHPRRAKSWPARCLTSSTIGARLARLTTEPDLLITDGEALILEDTPAVGTKGPIEGWMPFRSSRRVRCSVCGAPGNTINHATSYFVPQALQASVRRQGRRGVQCRLRPDRSENPAYKYLNIPALSANLGVFDFGGPGNTFRALSLPSRRHRRRDGHGLGSGPALTSATANAGGLSILAPGHDDLRRARARDQEDKQLTDKPFGVNMRADATDAPQRADLLIREGVKVAIVCLGSQEGTDHQAPGPRHRRRTVDRCREAMRSRLHLGARTPSSSRAAKVVVTPAVWQRHCFSPSVLDAVDIPVIAGGGFFDGRGLAAALAYGAAGVAMGTRFLLTSDSSVPDSVKQEYLKRGLTDTTVSRKVDGMPHRVLNTDLVNSPKVPATQPV